MTVTFSPAPLVDARISWHAVVAWRSRFGLFGQLNRTGLAAIVPSIWVFQLWISPIWLARFRFVPTEWFWKSLTDRKRPLMR